MDTYWKARPSQFLNITAMAKALIFSFISIYIAPAFVLSYDWTSIIHLVPETVLDHLWKVAYILPLLLLTNLMFKMINTWLHVYEINEDILYEKTGTLNRKEEEMELRKIYDSTLTLPFPIRLLGLGNITLLSYDETTPKLELRAIRSPRKVREQLRELSNKAKLKSTAKEVFRVNQ